LIHLYVTCWNEERLIPFFLRHYEPLVDRIVVWDDGSTDRSVELLRASAKVEMRPLPRANSSFLEAHQTMFETCWHECRGRADWVCLIDLDEFLFHPDWHNYLAQKKREGVTVVQALGYEMMSESFPEPGMDLATSIIRGERELHLDKTCLFSPNAIDRMNYVVGRHHCSPTGRVKFPAQYRMQLRHYKNLGLDYVLARCHELASRITPRDTARGWSGQYLRDDDSIRAHFQKQLASAEVVPSPRVDPPARKSLRQRLWSPFESRSMRATARPNER
jgi:glycosyltransferase involved in cell wall biosynthesis